MAQVTHSERDPLIPQNGDVPPGSSKGSHGLGPRELSTGTRAGILIGIWTGNFLSSLNLTLVPTMLPEISSKFGKSNQAAWLGTASLLAMCTFTPLYGRLCDILGRKYANQTAVSFAALGTLGCGLAGSMEGLIFARFITGIGAGGIITTSSIIVSDLYDLRTRGLAQGLASVFSGLGMGLGGPFGGYMTDLFGWRSAFLCQIPIYAASFVLTSIYLNYTVEGKQKAAKDVLKRIDFGGSFTLLVAVGSALFFLSTKYNEGLPWSHPTVIIPLVISIIFCILFVIVELFLARQPVLAPFLLKEPIPVLLGCSNLLVSACNFSIQYYFPLWFQAVMLTSASTAGLHIAPNSVSMSLGSLFAGWMMHRTGKYKMLNLGFGLFPAIATVLIYLIREDSGPIQSWFSIIPLGFGNAVVLQTMFIALLAHIPPSQMAVGTGFVQFFRGIGQVSGVAISSAIFQSTLESELRKGIGRLDIPDKEEMIKRIRHVAKLVETLPPDLQRIARDSYSVGLKRVFLFAAVSTFSAYIVRLPIPERSLDRREQEPRRGRMEEERVEPSIRPQSTAQSPIEGTRGPRMTIVR